MALAEVHRALGTLREVRVVPLKMKPRPELGRKPTMVLPLSPLGTTFATPGTDRVVTVVPFCKKACTLPCASPYCPSAVLPFTAETVAYVAPGTLIGVNGEPLWKNGCAPLGSPTK